MSERGVALVLVLLVTLTLSALALSLSVLVSTESRVAANYRDGLETLYVAEGALERVLPDIAAEADVSRVLAGVSTFIDGPPGPRRLPDGSFTDLHALTSMLNCERVVCGEEDLAGGGRWQLYGYGALPGGSRVYGVVWVADHGQAGPGRLSITAHGYGPTGARRVIEATVETGGGRSSVLSWREVR